MTEVWKGVFESAPTKAAPELQAVGTPLPTGKVTARCPLVGTQRCPEVVWSVSYFFVVKSFFFLSLKFFFIYTDIQYISISGVRHSDETFTYLPR